jgi:hypothetical protein
MFHTVRTAVAVALGIVAVASTAADAHAGETRRVIRIYGNGTEDQPGRAAASRAAAMLLADAGVVARWLDCSAGYEEAGCRDVRGPHDLVVRIVPRPIGPIPKADSVSTRESLTDPDLQLGFATFDSATRRGVLATVFHDRVHAVALRADLDYRVLMARAMAHEVGHLLLPASGHGATGLMRAVWTDAELAQNRRDDWVFAPAERERLVAATAADAAAVPTAR